MAHKGDTIGIGKKTGTLATRWQRLDGGQWKWEVACGS